MTLTTSPLDQKRHYTASLWSFSFWLAQIMTGLFLLGILSYTLNLQFEGLIDICTHGNLVFITRVTHMLGSNFALVFLILHIFKSTSFTRVLCVGKSMVWILGVLVFIIALGTAFTGYVLVAGNMSFWAAIVILNLATIVPVLADAAIPCLLGDAVLSSFGIRRFAVLHFALALLSLGLVFSHIIMLHRTVPSANGHYASDGYFSISHVLARDAVYIGTIFCFVFSADFWDLIHPDNWNAFDLVATPSHIEPEVYFLWTFSIIKLHNSKLAGALIHCWYDIYYWLVFTLRHLRHCSKPTLYLQFCLQYFFNNWYGAIINTRHFLFAKLFDADNPV